MKRFLTKDMLIILLVIVIGVLSAIIFRRHPVKDFDYYKDLTPGQLLDEELLLDVQIKDLQDTKAIVVELATDKVKTIREPLRTGDVVKDPIEQLNEWLGIDN